MWFFFVLTHRCCPEVKLALNPEHSFNLQLYDWLCLYEKKHSNTEVPNQYRAVEELLPGRKNVLGKMCIDMTLLFIAR